MYMTSTPFILHGVVDLAIGIPLWIAPQKTWRFVGYNGPVDKLGNRLLASAFLAIGLASLWKHNGTAQELKLFIQFKVIWSLLAIFAFAVTMISQTSTRPGARQELSATNRTEEYAPSLLWIGLVGFILFNLLWDCILCKMR